MSDLYVYMLTPFFCPYRIATIGMKTCPRTKSTLPACKTETTSKTKEKDIKKVSS